MFLLLFEIIFLSLFSVVRAKYLAASLPPGVGSRQASQETAFQVRSTFPKNGVGFFPSLFHGIPNAPFLFSSQALRVYTARRH